MPYVYTHGSGTENDPYQVWTADDLDGVRDHLSSYFVQMANINLKNASYVSPPTSNDIGWLPIGRFWTGSAWSVTGFTGKYDGQGYNIANLSTDWGSELVGRSGLFAYCYGNDAVLENIHVIGADIIGCGSQSGILVGMIESWDNNPVTIYQCSVQGTVSNATSGYRLGGIVGEAMIWPIDTCNIQECKADVIITGCEDIGVFAGITSATIKNCYARGKIIGRHYENPSWTSASLGGFIGLSWGEIENCYSAVEMDIESGINNVGGFCGEDWGMGTFTSCYYDKELNGVVEDGFGEPRTTAQMVYPYSDPENVYINWAFYGEDFDPVWAHDKGGQK